MNRSYTTILTTAMTLFLAYGQANAQGPQADDREILTHDGNSGRHVEHRGHRERSRPEQMVQMMTRRLELDETQSTQIQNIMAAAKPEFDALHEKGTANREATRGLEIDHPDYGAKLQNLSTTRGELAASSAELRGRIRAEIHAILTPEQREKLASVPERRRDRGRKHQQRPESQAPAQ